MVMIKQSLKSILFRFLDRILHKCIYFKNLRLELKIQPIRRHHKRDRICFVFYKETAQTLLKMQ